ncbi:hypothetical protein D3C75_601600 [compost metagenome]
MNSCRIAGSCELGSRTGHLIVERLALAAPVQSRIRADHHPRCGSRPGGYGQLRKRSCNCSPQRGKVTVACCFAHPYFHLCAAVRSAHQRLPGIKASCCNRADHSIRFFLGNKGACRQMFASCQGWNLSLRKGKACFAYPVESFFSCTFTGVRASV